MTICHTDITKPGVIAFKMADATRVNLFYDANTWNVEKSRVELKEPEDEGIRNNWNNQAIMRITLTSKKPLTKNNSRIKFERADSKLKS